MKKGILALAMLLVLCMVASFVPVTAGAADAASKWDGTSVSAQLTTEGENTYLIKSAADLAKFAAMVNGGDNFAGKTVKLTTDIVWNEGDASTWTKESTGLHAWTSIGTWGAPFAGTFDGQNHTVSGLWGTLAGNGGFFGNAGGADCVVKNFAVVNSKTFNTAGGNQGVVGVVKTAGITMENIYSDMDIEGNQFYFGGMIGNVHGGGGNYDVTIKNCVYAGTIKGSKYLGGLIGTTTSNANKTQKVTIIDSAFVGTVEGAQFVGGLVGARAADNAMTYTLTDVMSLGKVVCTDAASAGPISGTNNMPGANLTVNGTNVWFANNVVEGTAGLAGTAKAPADIAALTTDTAKAAGFENWVRTAEVGIMPKGVADVLGYADADAPFAVPAYEFKPDLSKASVYNGTKSTKFDEDKENKVISINSAADLALFAEKVNADYFDAGSKYEGWTVKLTTDIVWNTGDADAWAAGTSKPANLWACGKWGNPFNGVFDGQGHVISGLYGEFANDNCGFLGLVWTKGAEVKNLAIVNSTFVNTRASGNSNMGIIGTVGGGTIAMTNIYTDVNMVSSTNQVGGLIGRLHNKDIEVTIDNCVVAGSVTGGTCVGGFIGQRDINNGTKGNPINISNSVVLAEVKGAAKVGGFVGYSQDGMVNITTSIAAGKVTSADAASAGAFYGVTAEGEDAAITKSAMVKGTADKATGADLKTGYKVVEVADITGDKAATTLTDFDFAAAWAKVDAAAPMPASLLKMLKGDAGTQPGQPGTLPPDTSDFAPIACVALSVMAVAAAAVVVLRRKHA